MIHFKSKSTKIKEDTNNEEEKVNSDNDYVSTTVNQINSTKDNLSLNTLTDENYGKISSLLFEQDNNDKIVNISKLDESLCYNDKNTKRENNEQEIQQSNYEFIIKNITNNEENNNSNPVINISCLETQNNENKSDNNINSNNNNQTIKENNIEKNKISYKKDEVFLAKKKNKICSKKRIILILIIFCMIFSLFSFLFIKKINNYKNL